MKMKFEKLKLNLYITGAIKAFPMIRLEGIYYLNCQRKI